MIYIHRICEKYMKKSNKTAWIVIPENYQNSIVGFFLLWILLMFTNTAQAQIRMWKTGAPGGFNTVLHIQNQSGQIQRCEISWGNANRGFGNSTTIMVHPGRTEIVQTYVVAVNEGYRCNIWEDPFKAQQARQAKERQLQEEALRKAREQQAQQAQKAMLQNQRQQENSTRQALRQEQQHHEMQQVEVMRQQQQAIEADYQRRQEQSLRTTAQMEALEKQMRDREIQARPLDNAKFFSDQNQQILNSTRIQLGDYNMENRQLEEMVRALEKNRH